MDSARKVNDCETCNRACSDSIERIDPKPLPDDVDRLKWWLDLSRKQTVKLWELLQNYLDEEAQSAILEQLGRNCARSINWAAQYIGDPEGFFKFMYDSCGEVITYDREAGVITVATPERDCVCLLVNSGSISAVYCNCSMGWQQFTYETILNKKVDVTVEKAVIRGDQRCVFRIAVTDEAAADA